MDARTADAGHDPAELARLAARVATLERLVAELRGEPAPALELHASLAAPAALPAEPVAPPPLPAESTAPPLPKAPPRSLEQRLGMHVFNLVGAVAVLAGVSWFFKLAVEHGWIGPVARVLLGLFAGAGAVAWSERFRRRGYSAFSYTLKAVGTSILYFALWAAFQRYHLLPAGVALLAMLLVTAFNGYIAWAQGAELLAAYALAGGMATPLLLSTGGDHERFLFTYLLALDLALVGLARGRNWPRLLLPALAATAAYFAGWFARFFHFSPELTAQGWETLLFAVLFALPFAAVSVRFGPAAASPSSAEEALGSSELQSADQPAARSPWPIVPVLVPLAAAAFLSLAVAAVLEESSAHGSLAWTMLLLAAVYLGLTRVQATRLAAAVHLAVAVVLLTVSIPLKAHAHSLTTAWLVEGVALYWISTRALGEEASARRVLRGLCSAAFALGLVALTVRWAFDSGWAGDRFLSRDLASALVALLALGGTFALARRESDAGPAPTLCLLAADYVALLAALRGLDPIAGRAFLNARFLWSLLALFVAAAVAWTAARWLPALTAFPPALEIPEPQAGNLRQPRALPAFLRHGGGGAGSLLLPANVVLFNLIALAAGVHQIAALFAGAEGSLGRALAISSFLMLYGAALLALGFARQSAFLRWQGLGLLVVTIAKVFLFDTRLLSQLYRVASFVGLGIVLLGVSFAYQRDWLGLKQAPTPPPGTPEPPPTPEPSSIPGARA